MSKRSNDHDGGKGEQQDSDENGQQDGSKIGASVAWGLGALIYFAGKRIIREAIARR